MRIFSIELENFRMFEKQRVEFPAMFSVLIGENGSGKTTVLEAVAVFLQGGLMNSFTGKQGSTKLGDPSKPSPAMNRYFLDEFDNKVQAPNPKIGAEYETPNGLRESIDFYYSQTNGKIGSNENSTWMGWVDNQYQQIWETKMQLFANQSVQSIQQKGNPTLPVLEYFDTGSRSRRIEGKIEPVTNGYQLEHGYLGALQGGDLSREFFFSWFYTFEFDARGENPQAFVKEHLDCVKSAITSVIPEWKNIGFNLANNDLVGTLVTSDGQENRTFFRELSDGYRSIIILAATIAWRCVRLNPHLGRNAANESPGIVLIDELDQHLHPNWQKRIVGDLKRTFPNIQFICTTHSPFIVQSLSANEVIDLDGKIEYDPKDLQIGDVAKMMGVESPYSVENEEDAALAEQYLHAVRGIADDKEIFRGPSSNDEAHLDELEAKMADPTMRALLKLERLKYRK